MALPLDPAGGSAPDSVNRLALHVLAMHVQPTFFDLAMPCSKMLKATSFRSFKFTEITIFNFRRQVERPSNENMAVDCRMLQVEHKGKVAGVDGS